MVGVDGFLFGVEVGSTGGGEMQGVGHVGEGLVLVGLMLRRHGDFENAADLPERVAGYVVCAHVRLHSVGRDEACRSHTIAPSLCFTFRNTHQEAEPSDDCAVSANVGAADSQVRHNEQASTEVGAADAREGEQ